MARLVNLALFVAVAMAVQLVHATGIPNATSPSSASYATSINITGIFIPSNVSIYSPLPIYLNITNTGRYASGNITLGVQIYGDPEANLTFNFSGLSSGQSRLLLIYLSNVTGTLGGHAVYFTTEYALDGGEYQTGKAVSGYTVVGSELAKQLSSAGSGSLPDVEVTYVPFIAYVLRGSNLLSQLTVAYNGIRPVNLNIDVSSSFSGMLSMSALSLYLQPNQSLSSSMLFTPTQHTGVDTYTIPMTLTETLNGETKGSRTSYMQISTINDTSSMPYISQRVFLSGGGASSVGTVQIDTPQDYGLYGTGLSLSVPLGVAPNVSDIDAYGALAQVTRTNSSYVIDWSIGDLQRSQSVYLYYNIQGLENASQLADAQFVLSSSTQPSQNGDFNITGTVLPVFYVNSTEQIEVSLVYTGPAAAKAVFSMPSTAGVLVSNQTRFVSVVPNQQLEQTFVVTARNYSGTALLKLYITSGGVNSSYNLPIIILQRPTNIPTLLLSTLVRFRYELIAMILVLLALFAYALRRERRPKKYNPDRARQLIHLREQMNRDSI